MRLYLINGMHRSGTSAIAGVAQLLGADLGDPDDHLPPAQDNPRGFFELLAFKKANDALLADLGGTWDRLPTMTDGWMDRPSLSQSRAQAQEVVDSLSTTRDVVVLKDPRASLTLPVWASLTTISGTVTCIRHPSEVAASLVRRNGMTPDAAADLWIHYTAAALHHWPESLLVDYADLLASPEAIAGTLAHHLGLSPPSEDVRQAVRSFLAKDLRHPGTSPATEGRLAAAIWFFERIRAGEDVDALAELVVRRHPDAVSGVEEHEALVARLRSEQERTAKLKSQTVHLEESLQEASSQARAQREAAESRSSELAAQIADLREQTEYLRGRVRRREFDLHQLGPQAERQREGLESRIAELEKETRKYRDIARTLERSLRHSERDLERLRNRRSVKAVLKASRLARPVFRAVRAQRAAPKAEPAPALPETVATRASGRPTPPIEVPTEALGRVPQGPVTIVLPVYDAPDALRRCVDSLIRNTTAHARLVVVDDASRLPETAKVLDSLRTMDGITVLRNATNRGFTHSVNRGLAACDTDAIVLNSDTEVPPRWLERLQIAAYSDSRVGSATAISDDAGAFAVPVPGTRNPVPPHMSTDAVGRAVAAVATWALPETPTAHGFCTYLRRDMLEDCGLLDEEAFPRGYGEENDLSMRARARGWTHVVADPVFVRHVKGSSFGDERESLIAQGRAVINDRWPDYTDAVRTFMQGRPMGDLRDRIAALWAGADMRTGRPRALFIVHEGRGGTPSTTLDLASALEDRWQPFVLTSDTNKLRLHEVRDGQLVMLREWPLEAPIRFMETNRQDVYDIVMEVLLGYAIDLVHSRHLIKNTLDVLTAARALNIPTVVSFHDYYMSCPTVHLLDEKRTFCGGVCTPGNGPCLIPMQWIAEDAPPLKHAGVHDWRALVGPHLAAADALVTTAVTARDTYRASYPDLPHDAITVIEHGRDLSRAPAAAAPPEPGEKIRLLVPGNLDVHKGGDYLRRLLAVDTGGRLQIHMAGKVPDEFAHLGKVHGTYERDEFQSLVTEIEPHVIGIFSVWAETYCHTLTEGWMTGVPVMATDIGAPAERIRAHGGGILVPLDDPRAALEALFDLVDDAERYTAMAGPKAGAVRSTAEMADDYERLYTQVRARRRAFGWPEGQSLDTSLLALGTAARAPGSVHVRTQRPLTHPLVREHATVRRLELDELRSSPVPDVLVVQRTAVPPDRRAEVEGWLAATGCPLVFEVDDLLFDPDRLPAVDEGWAHHVETVRALMRRAAVVMVSTPWLAEAARDVSDQVIVVPNALDERLWFAPHDPVGVPHFEEDPPETLRLLYVGTATHAADLALLEPVMARLPERLGRPVRLSVVGGEPPRHDRHWYRHIPIRHKNYPDFVPWIRGVAQYHDVALAPLSDTPFTRAKSDLKWLEYTGMGLPGVYADLPPYATVEHGRTGMLAAPGDAATWVTAIEQLTDADMRKQVVSTALDEVLATRTLERSAWRWIDVLQRAHRVEMAE